MAKNVVAAGLASKCTIQIAYAIGVSKPLSLYVNTAGTGKIEDYKIAKILTNLVDMGLLEIFIILILIIWTTIKKRLTNGKEEKHNKK